MALTPTLWNRSPAVRPGNLPGMTRDNAPSRSVEPGLIDRITGNLRNWLGMQTPGSTELPFFPPGRPLDPIAPGTAGRRMDYPTSYNTVSRPRSYEPIDFETLRAIADPAYGGYDLIRLAIEARKSQVSKLEHSILPRKVANTAMRPKADARCQQMEELLRFPDGSTPWQQWCSQLVEEHLVIDAPAIYRRRALSGDTIRLELIDGATLKPLLNYDGRKPESGPAFQQVLKGIPANEYTFDELLYAPKNPRVHKVYGMSCVEQVLVTINIGLRRQAGQLGFFTEGNIPDAVCAVPPSWSTPQIAEFQEYWDTMVNDAVRRRKMRFVPAGVALQMTRNNDALVDQFDEWIARIIAYAFSLPPTPFVRMMNRATAESSYEEALSEGLQPLMIWLKSIVDYILANWFAMGDLELVWNDIRKVDPAEREERDIALAGEGAISLDDIRAERGLDPLNVPPFVKGIGPLGFMSVTSLIKCMENGWDITGVPQTGLPGGGAGGDAAVAGDTSLLGTGQPGDPLQGLPPEILQALGAETGTADTTSATDPGASPAAPEASPASPVKRVPSPGNLARLVADMGGKGGGGAVAGSSSVASLHKHPAVRQALIAGDALARRHAPRVRA